MNKLKSRIGLSFSYVFLIVLTSCSSDDIDALSVVEDEEIIDDDNSGIDTNSYILAVDPDDGVELINHDGETLFEWAINGLGDDAELQSDGSLVAIQAATNPRINFGGYGGKFIKINADQTTDWEFTYSSDSYISHHDVNYLSNGNIIFLIWEKVDSDDAAQMGFSGNFDIYPDAVIEMNPLTQEVVWEWHFTDHVIQDYDSNLDNYGVVADYPNKIDINYNSTQNDGDITHANGLTLDETNDLLYVTVNYYSEVWVIDHSTTTEEAATSEGGNYNLGGDLVYRFGNPLAYDNVGDVTLNRVHYPNLFDDNKMLVFANNLYNGQSAVVEYQLSPPYQLVAGQDNEPTVTWEFTDPDLYNLSIGGAVRMSNGNTLIAEGDGTIWEVNNNGDVLWQTTDIRRPWRAYAFPVDDEAITALGL
ncbi:arylsulfotransferase family protein [Zobellia alginiliquefaciens]|uniref:arylsulfotransferase family protein n=1 Tax=Zobellia alginiliquefaciens TaxID=3032586 RepID=UPI0023E3FA8A|nr:arylsulfotransferase family protein [Zobellia alginiliquefaciens]